MRETVPKTVHAGDEPATLLDELRELCEQLRCEASVEQVDRFSLYNSADYIEEYGGLHAALKVAGIDKRSDRPGADKRIPDEKLLLEVHRLAHRFESPPLSIDMDDFGVYSSMTYRNRWGDWETVLSLAGFESVPDERAAPFHYRSVKQAKDHIDEIVAEIPQLAPIHRQIIDQLYEVAVTVDEFSGRGMKDIGCAVIRITCNKHGVGIPNHALEKHGEPTNLMSTYRHLLRGLDAKVLPPEPVAYVEYCADELDLSDLHRDLIEQVLEAYVDDVGFSSKKPTVAIGTVAYMVGLGISTGHTQSDISTVIGTSNVSIRNNTDEFEPFVQDVLDSNSDRIENHST